MIIVGAKGFAKQLIEVFLQTKKVSDIYFFDDKNKESPDTIYGFKVLKDVDEAKEVLVQNPTFSLGIGQPAVRRLLADKFQKIGGRLTSAISPHAHLAHYVNKVGLGVTILTGATIENDASLGEGVLVNVLAVIHHDVIVGNYCEIGPGAKVLGECILGEDVFVGANAVILPKVKIGKGAIIGAGAIVTKDVTEGITVIGSPAKPIK